MGGCHNCNFQEMMEALGYLENKMKAIYIVALNFGDLKLPNENVKRKQNK